MKIFAKNISGLYINESSFSLVTISGSAENVSLEYSLNKDIPEGYIQNGKIIEIQKLTELIKKEIEKNKQEFEQKEIVLVIPEKFVLSDTFAVKIGADGLEKKLLKDVKTRFPVNLDQYVIDFDDFAEDDKNVFVTVNLVKRKIHDTYIELVKRLDFQIFAVEPANYSIKRLLQRNNQCAEGIAVLNLNHTYSTCMIYESCGLWISKTLNFNYDSATKVVSQDLGVDNSKAQEFVKRYGLGISPKNKNKKRILEAVIKNDTLTTQEAIRFCKSKFNVQVKKIIAFGGSLEIPYVNDYLKNHFDEKWEESTLHQSIQKNGKIIKKDRVQRALPAIGGALRILDDEPKKQMNLL